MPGDSLSVFLLTIEPGDAVWEVFGHNALVVRDAAAGVDAAFNYGMFSFDDPGYYARFLSGRMTYWVAEIPLATMLAAYRADDRRVWAQELDLEPTVKLELLRRLRDDARPENRLYAYQYFLDNCSTKLRDALDDALGGQLRRAADVRPAESTWREHTRRLSAAHPLGYLGIDLLLGPRGDEPTNAWDEMWVPSKLRDRVGALFVARSDGSRARLVRSEALWADSSRDPEPIAAPRLGALFLLVGAGVGLTTLFFAYKARARSTPGKLALALLGLSWAALCFAISVVLLFVHWTAHEFMHFNPNLLLFSPLGVGAGLSLVRVARKGRTSVWGRRFALSSAGLAALALVLLAIPGLGARNGEMAALALPVHAALCWAMLGIHRMDHALVYG